MLEDHADLLPAQAKLLFAQLQQTFSVQQNVPAVGAFQQIHTSHQRTLARAGQADHAENFPLADGEGHTLQSLHAAVFGREGFT